MTNHPTGVTFPGTRDVPFRTIALGLSMLLCLACESDDSRASPTRDSSIAAPANAPIDSGSREPDSGRDLGPGMGDTSNRDTCSSDEQCLGITMQSANLPPFEGRPLRLVRSACAKAVCDCPEEFICVCGFTAEDDILNPLSLGRSGLCDVASRSIGVGCLLGPDDFPGCDPNDSDSCDDLCANAINLMNDDLTREHEVTVRHATCEAGICRAVVEEDGQCSTIPPAQGIAKAYSCSLSDEEILAMADAEPTVLECGFIWCDSFECYQDHSFPSCTEEDGGAEEDGGSL